MDTRIGMDQRMGTPANFKVYRVAFNRGLQHVPAKCKCGEVFLLRADVRKADRSKARMFYACPRCDTSLGKEARHG